MSNPIVFFDIAGPDEKALRDFYNRVFDWPCGSTGEFAPGNAQPLAGNIRQDPKETVLYIGVQDVAVTLTQISEAGGTVDVPRFEVPGVAILGLFFDPAGNRVGLVEMANGEPKIP